MSIIKRLVDDFYKVNKVNLYDNPYTQGLTSEFDFLTLDTD